jgi:hypothetical protein
METRAEFTSAQVRKFLTVLFVTRARRHLRTLAEHYNWSPETLAANEARFIHTADCVPEFASRESWYRAKLPQVDDEDTL